MRKTVLSLAATTIIIAVVFIACSDSAASEKKKNIVMTETEKIQRGSYLVNAIGCDDCHSPKEITATGFEIIPELRLSGYQSAKASPKADSNVVKQGWLLFGSETSQIDLILNLKSRFLKMEINDNGKGFDPGTIKRGNGLNNLEKRAKEIGGQIEIKSQPRKGTCINLMMVLKKSLLTEK